MARFLDAQGALILDGGLATELERRGYALDDRLWSARLLAERPEAIRQLHADYLEAGADCLVTASYQATFEGLARAGYPASEAERLLRRSVELAREARDRFWESERDRDRRLRPLVAASVGPYGAFLADGSEYRGDYGKTEEELATFHLRRWRVLAAAGADLLAVETVPSGLEARALARLLDQTPRVCAWFSFTCRDGSHLADGSELAPLAAELSARPRIVALGVNCVPPSRVADCLRTLGTATDRPLVAYPNSGETWDAASRSWSEVKAPYELEAAVRWRRLGARLIGGCCRVGPEAIRALRRRLLG